jgi:uncharacterized protein involved in type VI secretion and phage assembly
MPAHEDPNRELKRLRAENERMRHELAVGRANLRELWQALTLIRDAIEELAPVGAMRSSEAVMGAHGPEPQHDVARQLELDARDNQGDSKPQWRCHGRLHQLPIILSDQTPVKPGPSGHPPAAASGLTGVWSDEGCSTDGCIANCR